MFCRAQRGLSLLEVSIAATLLGIVFVAILQMLTMHARQTEQSRNLVLATTLARTVLEEQLALGYSAQSIPATASKIRLGVDNDSAELDLQFLVDVQELAPNAAPTYKSVEVTVNWNDGTQSRVTRLKSYVAWQN